MELTPKQQALERIKQSEKILLLTHKQPDGDALGSILALTNALRKLNKDVVAIIDDTPPKVFEFLPGINDLQTALPDAGDFIISIDTNQTNGAKLGYKRDEDHNQILIIISPNQGRIRPEDVRLEPTKYDFNLIITLDCNSIERLGEFYNQHTPLFYETPLINIDHHADNEQFGAVNWVDVTATSTAEILVSLLEALGRDTSLLDSEVATDLLTGIITDTGSFKNANTTPKSLTVAAQLVAAGGRQQEIIHHIYKIKPISTLKLWGRALASIKEDLNQRILWTVVSKHDFEQTGAGPTETKGLVDGLLKTAQGVSFVFLITERDDGVHVSFRSVEKGIPVSEVAKLLGGGGHEAAAAAEIDDTLPVVEEKVLKAVAAFWETRKTA
jgi:bifunctional oligoribonuclease and PAP phosphatase NrnA